MHAKVHLLIARSCHLPRCKNLDRKMIECTRVNSVNSLMLNYANASLVYTCLTMQGFTLNHKTL